MWWFGVVIPLALPLLVLSDYSGYKLVRFHADEGVAEWLEKVEGSAVEADNSGYRVLLDVWREPNKNRPEADVLVAPEYMDHFTELLSKRGVHQLTVLNNDIEREFRRERRALQKHRRRRSVGEFDLETYHTYDEMVSFLRSLAKEHPDIVTLVTVSTSSEQRTIYGVKISRAASYKPAIFVDAGIHAREWVAPAAALYLINKVEIGSKSCTLSTFAAGQTLLNSYGLRFPGAAHPVETLSQRFMLVKGYGKDTRITQSVDKFDWFIVPQMNPDGYEYSRTSDRLWRKTRSRNVTVNRWCVGADANRNWGYRWGEAGANRSPCSNIYSGSHPFSEPEIAGVRDFITWQIPNLVIYVSLHSYGQLLLSPWGYTNARTANHDDQREAARAAVRAMRGATGANYSFGTISELMYPASGTSIDYMQSKGVPYIYGVELRPTDGANTPAFNLPQHYIKPTGEEMLAGLLAMGEYAVERKRL